MIENNTAKLQKLKKMYNIFIEIGKPLQKNHTAIDMEENTKL